MSKTEFPSPREPRQVEGRSLLSMDECRQIAGEFDGTTECIDALLKKWSAIKPGVKRHTIIRAAKRGGYQTTKDRKDWTPDEDRFLRENWHRMSADEIAAALGRGFNSVNLRRKRIGIGRYDGEDLTIRDLEELTRIDHRQWHDFVARGWLRARQRGRRKGAVPITYVSLNALRSLLTDHPEIYDYRRAPKATIVALELDRLPEAIESELF